MRKTALHAWHKKNGELIDFNGWEMPVRYTSINEEHLAVRNNAGFFDVSHMGRYMVTGSDAEALLDILVPRNIASLKLHQAGYTFMLNENAGFHDDVIVTKMDENEYLVVCNAGNREKIWNWIKKNIKSTNVKLSDISDHTSMIAIQGPNARKIISDLAGDELPKRFRVGHVRINNEQMLFSGTGYTGEDGGELFVFAESEKELITKTEALIELLLNNSVVPCGLGARDTLRMEAGYSLYGNDITEDIDVVSADLAFKPFLDMDKQPDFIGKSAVSKLKHHHPMKRVFFKLIKKGVPRHDYKIYQGEVEVGFVSSGTISPLTKEGFGIGYIKTDIETENLSVLLHKKPAEIEVIKFPLYDSTRYGISRT